MGKFLDYDEDDLDNDIKELEDHDIADGNEVYDAHALNDEDYEDDHENDYCITWTKEFANVKKALGKAQSKLIAALAQAYAAKTMAAKSAKAAAEAASVAKAATAEAAAVKEMATAAVEALAAQRNNADLQCPVCLCAPIERPASTPCGHVFCAECIMRALRLAERCPMCNQDMFEEEVHLLHLTAPQQTEWYSLVEQGWDFEDQDLENGIGENADHDLDDGTIDSEVHAHDYGNLVSNDSSKLKKVLETAQSQVIVAQTEVAAAAAVAAASATAAAAAASATEEATAEASAARLVAAAAESALAAQLNNADLQCAVCLCATIEGPASTPCGHVFCAECIREALQVANQCPTCDRAVYEEELHVLYLSAPLQTEWFPVIHA